MAYIITKTNGSQLAIVDDGSIDIDATDLSLLGKNYSGYGQAVNQNFVKLLENFANTTAPLNPTTGQIWYDTATKKVKFYNGREFKGLPALQSSSFQPNDLLAGDLWFDDSENKLYYYDGSIFNLIGPQFTGQTAINTVLPAIVEDTDGFNHYILKHQIQSYSDESVITTVAITSSDAFDINPSVIPGYTKIKQGITLYGANATTGVSADSPTGDPIIWGTAADSLLLAGNAATNYVTYNNPSFTVGITGPAAGLNLDTNKLRLFIDADVPKISSNADQIRMNVTSGGILYNVFNVDANSDLAILPSKTAGQLCNIGSATYPWNTIYSTGTIYCSALVSSGSILANLNGNVTGNITGNVTGNLSGNATNANNLRLGGVYVAATTTNTANTIVARDASGNFSAGTITAIASQAKYADLAERYSADTIYEPGTVLEIGGVAEVTVTTFYASEKVVGVVSTDPAYLMNSELENGVAIALRGRVPCKVVGPIKRGDALVSSAHPGYAASRNASQPVNPLTIIGKALQDFNGDFGIIEILV
jgi:hypothetical protein